MFHERILYNKLVNSSVFNLSRTNTLNCLMGFYYMHEYNLQQFIVCGILIMQKIQSLNKGGI